MPAKVFTVRHTAANRVMAFEAAPHLAHPCVMRSVERIEAALRKLPRAGVHEVAKWLAECEAGLWDKQMEEDGTAGKLDWFIEEALDEHRQGKTCPLP